MIYRCILKPKKLVPALSESFDVYVLQGDAPTIAKRASRMRIFSIMLREDPGTDEDEWRILSLILSTGNSLRNGDSPVLFYPITKTMPHLRAYADWHSKHYSAALCLQPWADSRQGMVYVPSYAEEVLQGLMTSMAMARPDQDAYLLCQQWMAGEEKGYRKPLAFRSGSMSIADYCSGMERRAEVDNERKNQWIASQTALSISATALESVRAEHAAEIKWYRSECDRLIKEIKKIKNWSTRETRKLTAYYDDLLAKERKASEVAREDHLRYQKWAEEELARYQAWGNTLQQNCNTELAKTREWAAEVQQAALQEQEKILAWAKKIQAQVESEWENIRAIREEDNADATVNDK